MRISDWSSDVCSSDLFDEFGVGKPRPRTEPGLGKTAPGETASLFGQPPATEAKPEPVKVFEEKLVHLLIAEREGTAIFGPKIHQALASQNLQYGDRKIYHRMENGEAVFSIGSAACRGGVGQEVWSSV